MEYLIGVVLGFAIAGLATVVGFDRERSFYPTVLIVIASYYVLFAVMGPPGKTLAVKTVIAGAFLLIAVLGFKTNLWLIVAALIGHGSLTSSITCSSKTRGAAVVARFLFGI